jgi:hypothetical protein
MQGNVNYQPPIEMTGCPADKETITWRITRVQVRVKRYAITGEQRTSSVEL